MQSICVVQVGEICSEKGPGGSGGATKGRRAEGLLAGGVIIRRGPASRTCMRPGESCSTRLKSLIGATAKPIS